jgi:hypothetical protein
MDVMIKFCMLLRILFSSWFISFWEIKKVDLDFKLIVMFQLSWILINIMNEVIVNYIWNGEFEYIIWKELAYWIELIW